MARGKNPIVCKPGARGKQIWRILQTKRSESSSGSSQSQTSNAVKLDRSIVISEDEAPTSNRNTARKSTGAIMDEVIISDSDDPEDVQKPVNSKREVGKTVKYKSKDGTIKKRYAPG